MSISGIGTSAAVGGTDVSTMFTSGTGNPKSSVSDGKMPWAWPSTGDVKAADQVLADLDMPWAWPSTGDVKAAGEVLAGTPEGVAAGASIAQGSGLV